jgi:exodeoxyribonuclease V gamma subunit
LLAMTVTDPRPWRAITVGRGSQWNPGTSVLGPVSSQFATTVLADLVDLYRVGLTEPLPLPPATAAEYARIRKEDKPLENLRERLVKEWDRERDPEYERFFGAGVTFQQLTRPASRPEEERGSLAEPSRFGTLARRLWHPLLISEELGS